MRLRRGLLAFLATLELGFGGCLRSGYSAVEQQSRDRADGGPAGDGGALFASDGGSYGLYTVGRYPFGGAALQPKATAAYVLDDGGSGDALDAAMGARDAGASPDAGAVADPMLGTWWVAQLTDAVGSHYAVCMSVSQVQDAGSMAGQIAYSNGLDCTGYLLFQQVSGGVYTFDEYITAGANQRYCQLGGGGRMETTLITSDSIHWQWHRRMGTSIIAESALDRVSACP